MGRFGQREPFDPHELGARRSDPTLAALEPLPPAPRRTSTRHLLLYFALGVLALAILRDGVGRSAPMVTGSCTMPSFALDKTEVPAFGVIKWSAAGPADASVVIGFDTSTVPTAIEQGKLAGPVALTGCAATGRFGMRGSAGDHVLTVFLVARDGSSRILKTQKIVVTGP
jgi:hypothetical protein